VRPRPEWLENEQYYWKSSAIPRRQINAARWLPLANIMGIENANAISVSRIRKRAEQGQSNFTVLL
jgi:hypothetical protein